MHIEHQDSSASQLNLPFLSDSSTRLRRGWTAGSNAHPLVHTLERLQVQDGSPNGVSLRRIQQTDRELRKMSRELDAKRAQHRKMERWSRKRYFGKLISRPYLRELVADITWLEGRLAKASFRPDPSRACRNVRETHSPSPFFGNGASA